MKRLQEKIRETIIESLADRYEIDIEDIQFSIPPERSMGDLATTLPFVLAKRIGQKPFMIGQEIIAAISGKLPFVEEVKLAGGGFMNFVFKRDFLFPYLLKSMRSPREERAEKVIVEHTSINPNKSAHIGHLRNAAIGDSLVQALRFLGYRVEVQNYIDDTGIQVADVVWGLLMLEQKSLAEVQKMDHLAEYLWDLYSRAHQLLEDSPQRKEERDQIHKDIERKEGEAFEMSEWVAAEVLRDHLRVMDRLHIRYDLLVRESDIIELNFFTDTAEKLKNARVMFLSADPAKKGCWVIHYRKEDVEKIVIRSNGTVTYIGKDIAYTFWKLGRSRKDFFYQPFSTYSNGHTIRISSSGKGEKNEIFGRGDRVYNVIDVRQSYLQAVIQQVLAQMESDDLSRRFVHFSYEMVALTPRCVRDLGLTLSPGDEKKSYVEVSGRKGIAVKADHLIDRLEEKTAEEVRKRHPDLDAERTCAISRDIAVGALRYFMIRFNSKSVIAFDFKDALAFEGETGPYLQYTLVRIRSIMRKLEGEPFDTESFSFSADTLADEEWALFYDMVLRLSLLDLQVELAIDSCELATLAGYAYALCQMFNHYYHLFPVVAEKNQSRKQVRVHLLRLMEHRLEILFSILGIPVPEMM